MPVVTKMLEQMGPSDFMARVEKLMREGITNERAQEVAAQQLLSENHRMLRALLLMHGRSTDSDAVHTLR